MIRTVRRLDLAPGHADDLVHAFRDLEILETSLAQEGCESAETAISTEGREAMVTATWADKAAYARWTRNLSNPASSIC